MIPEILAEIGIIGPLGAVVEVAAVFFAGKVFYDFIANRK